MKWVHVVSIIPKIALVVVVDIVVVVDVVVVIAVVAVVVVVVVVDVVVRFLSDIFDRFYSIMFSSCCLTATS